VGIDRLRVISLSLLFLVAASGLMVGLGFGFGSLVKGTSPPPINENAAPPPEGINYSAGFLLGLGLGFLLSVAAAWVVLRRVERRRRTLQ